MKIATIIPSLAQNALTQATRDLAEALKEYAQVDFFYFEVVDNPVQIDGATELFFRQLHTFEGYDIVHSHGLRPDAYVWYHSKNIVAKKITTIHNYVEEDLTEQYNRFVSAVFWRIWKFVSGEHDCLVVLSDHMKAYYQDLWEKDEITVIPNTRKVNKRLKPKLEIVQQIEVHKKGASILIGSVANVQDEKGLDQLIRLLPIETEMKLVLIGEGVELEALKSLAKKLQVESRCLFLGNVVNGYLYLPFIDVFAAPSRSEGFPLTILEAIQMQVPVVASDIPVMKEAFNKKEVFFFKLENINGLGKAIKQAHLEGQAATQRALNRFEDKFSPKRVAQLYLNIYKHLLAQGM